MYSRVLDFIDKKNSVNYTIRTKKLTFVYFEVDGDKR